MSKLSELIAAAKAARNQSVFPKGDISISKSSCEATGNSVNPDISNIPNQNNKNNFVWNTEQSRFISLATDGNDCILIGAAGTGKTTCMKGMIQKILSEKYIPILKEGHKYLTAGNPGIVACSYTRRAVANLRKAMPNDLKSNCITIHKLLEYRPEYYEIFDEKTGEYRNTMKFEAHRTRYNPLDSSIKIIIIDESSMLSVELFNEIKAACLHEVQFIFLGDIQQLPPVFGSAILGYKMVELPRATVELTQVYRQALESPIIRLAHRILSGKPIPVSEYPDWKVNDKLTIHPWKKKISADSALYTLASFFKNAYNQNVYNPDEDMILIPFNKSCGTDELNKHIANYIAKSQNKPVYEIQSGFLKTYLSIGDKVLYDKEDAEVISISHNGQYSGTYPQTESPNMDYWGHVTTSESDSDKFKLELQDSDSDSDSDIDSLLTRMSSADSEDKVNQASHIVTLLMKDSEEEVTLSTAGEINSLILGYALTFHKSQGSEWNKVFLILHQSHATMIQRELLYTGVTRAREELYIICEPDSFTKGILNQRIKGNTLLEKSEYFKGKISPGK